MSNQNKLIDAIQKISEEYWEEFERPILLSALPVRLVSEVENYREILDGRSLKIFIQETLGENKYKAIEHPILKAKVGVIPANKNYEFSDAGKAVTKNSTKNTRDAALGFISALAGLSAEDLREVNIPTHVWVKLLK